MYHEQSRSAIEQLSNKACLLVQWNSRGNSEHASHTQTRHARIWNEAVGGVNSKGAWEVAIKEMLLVNASR